MKHKLTTSFLFTCSLLPVTWLIVSYTNSSYVYVAEAYQGDAAYEAGNKARRDLRNADAVKHYRKAALLGNKKAQFRLALLCSIDPGACKDRSESVRWMKAAAEQDYTPAQRVLGHWTLLGYGVEKNPIKAKKLLLSAANKEDDIAMYILGRMYATGEGVEKNYDEALKWFRSAKAHGYPLPAEYLNVENLAGLKPLKSRQPVKKIIKSREDIIREVQSGLTALGYEPGPVDGVMGKKTQTAIRAFQQKAGMPVDGKISKKLLQRMTEELKR